MSAAALLASVCEQPNEDMPRLIYADWLEEHGGPADQARAAFIRTQIEWEQAEGGSSRQRALERQASDLVRKFGRQWLAELPDWAVKESPHLIGDEPDLWPGPTWGHFRRGFVERIRCLAARWIVAGDGLLQNTPIRELRLDEARDHVVTLMQQGSLKRLTLLHLGDNDLGYEIADALIGSPSLGRLRTLLMPNNRINASAIRELARAPLLDRLDWLDLSGNQVGDAGAGALARSPRLGRLSVLKLRDNHLGYEGARALASSSVLDGLTLLDVRDNDLSPRAREALDQRFGERVLL